MARGALAMDSALAEVRRHCREAGIPLDRGSDPNQTCLIGPELSELMSSLGQAAAKRTTTSPDMAGLLVHLLTEAGVGPGDPVAVGASGSFPGFLVATLAAVRALEAQPVTILSLGASSYGATRPEFHLLDLYRVLEGGGFVATDPAGVSLGGGGDVGEGFDPAFRDRLLQELQEGTPGFPGTLRLFQNPHLVENVAERMEAYGRPAVFVNIGGAEANLGTSPAILRLPPGLALPASGAPAASDSSPPFPSAELPPQGQRGVVFEMLAQGIPVIHLLHVQGLALRYGLAWDPVPLPAPGSTRLRDAEHGEGMGFWLLTLAYAAGLVFIGMWRRGAEHEERGAGGS